MGILHLTLFYMGLSRLISQWGERGGFSQLKSVRIMLETWGLDWKQGNIFFLKIDLLTSISFWQKWQLVPEITS